MSGRRDASRPQHPLPDDGSVRIRATTAGESPLLHDYLLGEATLAPFYYGHPADAAAYERKAAEVATRFDTDRRAAIASALRPVSVAAEARLRAVIDGGGFMVTTGQQAGLFGGPLFTVYKALTAVRVADALQARLGAPVLPVFWIASEDHDWAEVDHTWVPGPGDSPVRIALTRPPDSAEASMARQRVGDGAADAIRALERLLPEGPESAAVADVVRNAYSPDATMADAFRDVLAWLLADQPLCTISAADPVLKRLSVPLLRTAVEAAAEHAAAVERQSGRLAGAGYDVQVAVEAGAAHVHFEDDAGRERLLIAGDGFRLRRTKRRMARDELLRRLDDEPSCISPGALLRPVVESALLPTLAYVGGPAETSYFAQIGCLFRAYGVMPPVVVPRAAFQIVERPMQRLLEKLQLDVAAVRGDAASLVKAQLDADLPDATGAALAELKLAMSESWSRLRAEAEPIDPTLAVPLRRLEEQSLRAAEAADARVRLHHRRRHEQRARQIERLCGRLQPNGRPQERVLNALPFVACHGRGLVRDLAEAVGFEPREGDRWRGPKCAS